MEKRHRIFIAINLPNDIRRGLAKYSQKWPELPAKWTDAQNLHITLEFLGHITDMELADVCQVVKDIAQRHRIFSISLKKILYGPPQKMPPRMVWAEGEKSKNLAELKNDLQQSLLEKVNYRPEDRSYSPHITLARINEWEWKKIEPEERPEVGEDIDMVFDVESIEVMESELKRGGPTFVILESHQLCT